MSFPVDASLNIMADALRAAATHASLHSAAAGTTGANETSDARQPIVWGASAAGDFSLSGAEAFTGPADGACVEVGLWTGVSGGTFLGSFPLTGDQSFNAAGEYSLDGLDISGS